MNPLFTKKFPLWYKRYRFVIAFAIAFRKPRQSLVSIVTNIFFLKYFLL